MDSVVINSENKIEKIAKRDADRRLELTKVKNDKKLHDAENEKLEFFESAFNEKRVEIEGMIKSALEIPQSDLAQHFNVISKEILVLQKYVAASTFFLRVYDIKKCNEHIQELTNSAKTLEDTLLPKKKFGFKARIKKTQSIPEIKIDVVDASKKLETSNNLFNFIGFVDQTEKNLRMERDEINKKDVSLSNLTKCKVKLVGSPSTLHISNLSDCEILSGPVSTSVFIDNCTNCTLVIACQQMRLHSSKNMNIYLLVTSRGIIEDSSDINVAPFELKYDGIEADFESSGLNLGCNNWDNLDDFNWLHLEQKSPNWSVLPEAQRTAKWSF